MTPRPAPVLAIAPSLTAHESGGTWTQPSSDLPSKIGLVSLRMESGRVAGGCALSSGCPAAEPVSAAPQMSPAPQVMATPARHHKNRTDTSPEEGSAKVQQLVAPGARPQWGQRPKAKPDRHLPTPRPGVKKKRRAAASGY